MTTPLRFGLLGTGPWARLAHGPALAAHPGVEFAGVWGRRPEAAAEVADMFGTRAYGDADALIADVDAVAIALPPARQAHFAAIAANAGRHLLLDKPLASTVEDARAVVDAVERAGVTSVVFFTMRFDAKAANWIEQQAATGEWYTGRADWYGSVFGTAPEAAPGSAPTAPPGPAPAATPAATPGTGTGTAPSTASGTKGDEPAEGAAEGANRSGDQDASPFAASPWRREKGGLWDVGPHALSVLLPVLGDVTDVRAARGPRDTVHLTLRHTGGASSTAVLTLSAPAAGAGVGIEFRGTHGVATYPEELSGTATDAFARAIDAVVAGRPHPCDARFGLRVTEILAAAEHALGQALG